MARPHNSPDVFRAVAHPVRRRMLNMLRIRSRTAAELAEPFPLTQATISEHIRALRVAGLVVFRTRGPHNVYSLVLSKLRPLNSWIQSIHRRS